MSVSDFEEEVSIYVWRGVVLAGLLTVLWGILIPAPAVQIQSEAQAAANTASSRVRMSAANDAR